MTELRRHMGLFSTTMYGVGIILGAGIYILVGSAAAETMFFVTAGILYMPFGIWMIKNKMSSRAPYVISLIGSVVLIILYIASRNVNLPIVGQQEDVGVTDLVSKVFQAGIIAICSILLVKSKRFEATGDSKR